MTRSQFEKLLRAAGELARDRDFFLIGSQALRGICQIIPRDFPKTIEADLYPRRHPQAWAILRSELGRESAFFNRNGYYLDCTDPGLANLPEGWTERLIPYRSPRTGGVTAWCLEPNDLFVSKLAAWREKDQVFLKSMLRHKFAKPAIVRERIGQLPIPLLQKGELAATLSELIAEIGPKPRTTRKKN